jgi:hypothetical protein
MLPGTYPPDAQLDYFRIADEDEAAGAADATREVSGKVG